MPEDHRDTFMIPVSVSDRFIGQFPYVVIHLDCSISEQLSVSIPPALTDMVALVAILVTKRHPTWKLELGPFEKKIDGNLLRASTSHKFEPGGIIGYLP